MTIRRGRRNNIRSRSTDDRSSRRNGGRGSEVRNRFFPLHNTRTKGTLPAKRPEDKTKKRIVEMKEMPFSTTLLTDAKGLRRGRTGGARKAQHRRDSILPAVVLENETTRKGNSKTRNTSIFRCHALAYLIRRIRKAFRRIDINLGRNHRRR